MSDTMTALTALTALTLRKDEIDVALKCSLCWSEIQSQPKFPCLHAFCMGCYNSFIARNSDQQPDGDVPCPDCKTWLLSSKSVMDGRPLDTPSSEVVFRRGSREEIEFILNCEQCLTIGEVGESDSFCLKCLQSLCRRCRLLHTKSSYTKNHQIVNINPGESALQIEIFRDSYCHDSNCHNYTKCNGACKVEFYCMECKLLICLQCQQHKHYEHRCEIFSEFLKKNRKVVMNKMASIESSRTSVSNFLQKNEAKKDEFFSEVSSAKSEIRNSVTNLQRLLKNYEDSIMEKLDTIVDQNVKELESERERLEVRYSALDSLLKRSTMSVRNTTVAGVTKVVEDLRREADKLIKSESEQNLKRPYKKQLKFIQAPSPIEQQLQLLVGTFSYTDCALEIRFLSHTREAVIEHKKKISGIALIDDNIYVSSGVTQSNISVYDLHTLVQLNDIRIEGMTFAIHIVGCTYNRALYISDCKNFCIFKYDITTRKQDRWQLSSAQTPQKLTLKPDHGVLVSVLSSENSEESNICVVKSIIVEFNSEGQCILSLSISDVFHLVNHTLLLSATTHIFTSTSGLYKFTYSNGTRNVIMYGNSATDDDGSQLSTRMNVIACSIAQDHNTEHIFAADYEHTRILLLDTNLKYLGQVNVSAGHSVYSSLYFDLSSDILFAGESGGRLRLISPKW